MYIGYTIHVLLAMGSPSEGDKACIKQETTVIVHEIITHTQTLHAILGVQPSLVAHHSCCLVRNSVWTKHTLLVELNWHFQILC